MPGVTTKLTVTGIDGDMWTLSGFQLSQSTRNGLHLPYVSAGLGRTNNYVEHFWMGFPNGHVREWSGLIPNSEVFAVCHPPSEPELWQLELFIVPSEIIGWVVFTLGLTIGALAVPIFLYRRREIEEDKREKTRIGHMFSFEL